MHCLVTVTASRYKATTPLYISSFVIIVDLVDFSSLLHIPWFFPLIWILIALTGCRHYAGYQTQLFIP